eukprot:GILK01005769.1.p1 GENE.GILK01005769.1~~GILK01005769.1.p1  ORF type:complete len:166 (+),score=42.75 GILK01005769.1:128-625(+)
MQLRRLEELRKRRELISREEQNRVLRIDRKKQMAQERKIKKANASPAAPCVSDVVPKADAVSAIAPFLNVNSHLKTPLHDNPNSTKAYKEMEAALRRGDHELAEKLNEKIVRVETAQTVLDAIDAKRYVDERMAEEKYKAEKKRKKKELAWTFQKKNRWEMKGNM